MTTAAAHPPIEDSRDRASAALGMAIFIGSWAMAFAVLFLSFLILRHKQPAWPPAGVTLPSLPLALAGTAVLLGSSYALHRSVSALRRGDRYLSWWNVGLVGGLVFAVLQTWLWADLWSVGSTTFTGGIYESLFYGLTWFHGLHVLCGLVALAAARIGAATGRYGHERRSFLVNAAVFWHFVDVVWIVLFFCFFVP